MANLPLPSFQVYRCRCLQVGSYGIIRITLKLLRANKRVVVLLQHGWHSPDMERLTEHVLNFHSSIDGQQDPCKVNIVVSRIGKLLQAQ